MTLRQGIFYGAALVLVLLGVLAIEGAPVWAFGLIAGAGLSVRAAER